MRDAGPHSLGGIAWVTERLAVGGALEVVGGWERLAADGITRVVSLRENQDDLLLPGAPRTGSRVEGSKIVYSAPCHYWSPMPDDGTARDPEQVRAVVAWILRELADGQRVYVHCSAGVNRSTLMCYAALRAVGLTRFEAVGRVHNARNCAAFFNHRAYLDSVDEALGYEVP